MSYLNVYFDDVVFIKVYPINCQFIDLIRQYKMFCKDETSGITDIEIVAQFGGNNYTIPNNDISISDPIINSSTILKMNQELPNH